MPFSVILTLGFDLGLKTTKKEKGNRRARFVIIAAE